MPIVDAEDFKSKNPSTALSRSRTAWILLFLSFITLRLTWLLTSIESLYWPEEIYRGTLTLEWLRGLTLPVWDYMADGYDAGPLWISTLAVPFFKLFGSSIFSLKLVSLTLSGITLFALIGFMRRFFGSTAAWWSACFYIFSPPVFAGISLYSIGSHPESPFFSILLVWMFYEMVFCGKSGSFLFTAAWGLVAGLAFWYTSITGITTLTLVLAWFWIGRSSLKFKTAAAAGLGFALGLAPLILYNALHGGIFGGFLYDAFVATSAQKSLYPAKLFFIPLRAARLILQTLPFSFCFKPLGIVPGAVFSLMAYGLLGLLTFPLYRRSVPALIKPVLLFPLVFLAVYAVSNYGTFYNFSSVFYSYRYFAPLYFFLFLLMGISLSYGRASKLGALILILLGLFGQSVYVCRDSASGLAFQYKGASYLDLGRVLGPRYLSSPGQIPEMVRTADRLTEKDRHEFYLGVADAAKGGFWGPLESLLEWTQKAPSRYRPYFAEGWGTTICDPAQPDLDLMHKIASALDPVSQKYFWFGVSLGYENASPPDFSSWIRLWPEKNLSFFYEAYGQALYYDLFSQHMDRHWQDVVQSPKTLPPDAEKFSSLAGFFRKAPEAFRPALLRGLGQSAASFWAHWGEEGRAFSVLFSLFEPQDYAPFYQGMGFGFRRDMAIDRERALYWISLLPDEPARKSALEGLRKFEDWYGLTA